MRVRSPRQGCACCGRHEPGSFLVIRCSGAELRHEEHAPISLREVRRQRKYDPRSPPAGLSDARAWARAGGFARLSEFVRRWTRIVLATAPIGGQSELVAPRPGCALL